MGAALIAEQGLRAISMELQEHTLTAQLAKRDSSAFEEVFKTYFKNLHAYACTIVKDEADAEEAVQQVFFKLWERAEHLSFSGSVAAYLYRAVHNQCLNQLKHQKVKANHQLHVAYSMKNESVNGPVKMISKELEQKIRKH